MVDHLSTPVICRRGSSPAGFSLLGPESESNVDATTRRVAIGVA